MDLSGLTISATKPTGKPARMLAELGLEVVPVEEDEGNVDRYLLSKRLAVERRTGSSFLRGITDKTLFTSAIYLREHFAIPVLIVEGEVSYEHTRFSPQAVRGALSSMMLSYGLSVVSTSALDDTVALIAMMTRQEQAGIPEISLVPKRKAMDLPDVQRRVVEMLPGCGRVMARNLLQRFGTVRRVVNAQAEDLCEVRGVGAKRAAEMRRALDAEYESVDTERDLEDAVEAAPELLFRRRVRLLARQHGIAAKDARHVVDLVFVDPDAGELVLVEVKQGKLGQEHYEQLRRYLDSAHQSRLLRPFLDEGMSLRGLLVTTEAGPFRPDDPSVSVHIVGRQQVIRVLKRLRLARASPGEA